MKTGTFYEINVARNGQHVFATDTFVRNYTDSHILKLILLFKEKFPKEEKYEISVTAQTCMAIPSAITDEIKKALEQ